MDIASSVFSGEKPWCHRTDLGNRVRHWGQEAKAAPLGRCGRRETSGETEMKKEPLVWAF